MNLAILFSGGKDSNYVTYLASKENNISCLITLKSDNPNSYMFQSVGNELIKHQAKSMQIPLLEQTTKGEKETELKDLKKALQKAKEKYKIEGVVTGAIKSCYQASRIQKIAKELDLWCYNPIWQINEDEYMDKLLEKKFDIKIFGIFSYPFQKPYLGKTINQEFLNKLKQLRKEYQISIAGEGGEYESFILDGPNYAQKLEIENIQTNMDSENSGIITNCEIKLKQKEETKIETETKSNKIPKKEETKEILIINLNQKNNELYKLEYINPIINIIKETTLVKENQIKIINYIDLKETTTNNYKKIIIAGTSLKEFEYLNHLNKFQWIKNLKENQSLIGICAGCQIIQKTYKGAETKSEEIGLFKPEIITETNIVKKQDLKEIYCLHQNSFSVPEEFITLAKTKIPQIIKHKEKNIYGTLFHPEARNPQLITNFINNN